jgi:hypothetical protein
MGLSRLFVCTIQCKQLAYEKKVHNRESDPERQFCFLGRWHCNGSSHLRRKENLMFQVRFQVVCSFFSRKPIACIWLHTHRRDKAIETEKFIYWFIKLFIYDRTTLHSRDYFAQSSFIIIFFPSNYWIVIALAAYLCQ